MHSQAPNRVLSPTPLTPLTFSQFGEVIQNPATHDELDGNGQWRLEHQIANQGTATKWLDVTHMNNHYDRAPSRKAARVVMNMFVCKPRTLSDTKDGRQVFKVGVLERHPYTPQTFVPMGLGKGDPRTRYLVIVAPTLPARSRSGDKRAERAYPVDAPKRKRSLKERLLNARPNPFTNDHNPSTTPPFAALHASQQPKGPGLPDLKSLRAFVARGDQAVTYGPGTWHAPMVVLGEEEIEFVVVQYANGVGNDDCQECEIDAAAAGEGLVVDISDVIAVGDVEASKPGHVKAKL